MATQKKVKASKIPPRRGPPLKGEPSARERILEKANELFYREGIRAIGIDTVIAESGVSKASLYRAFESKDELVAAVIGERDRLFWVWWDSVADKHPSDPRAVLRALFAGMAKRISAPDFRGCPFINVSTEFPAPEHAGRVLAQANKTEMRDRLAGLCARAGMSNPDRRAAQLVILVNGAYATGQMATDTDLAEHLVDASNRLLV